MIVLEFIAGPLDGQRLELDQDRITFGRDPESLVPLGDGEASWNHAVLERVAGRWRLTDQGSSNGTYVQGKPITQPVFLSPDDLVQMGVGRFRARIELARAKASRALNLQFVSGPLRGRATSVSGAWVAVGSGEGCQLGLPGIEPVAAYFVETALVGLDGSAGLQTAAGKGYALQPNEGARDILVDGAFVGESAMVDEGSIVQIGAHGMQASYGEPVADTLAAGPVSVAPSAVSIVASRSVGGVLHAPDWREVGPEQTVVLERPPGEFADPVPRDVRMRPRLTFIAGPHLERVVYVGTSTVTVGRRSVCDIRLSDVTASRKPLQLEVRGEALWARGLEASRPASINNEPLVEGDERQLEHGDLLNLGLSVLEYGVGGIDPEDAKSLATLRVPPARFSFNGRVLQQETLTIGRNPALDLFLDGEGIDRSHCELRGYYGAFTLTDSSDTGTYVNGRRVVEHVLASGEEIAVGDHKIQVLVDGNSCTLDIAAPVNLAAVETFAPGLDANSAQRTLYRITMPPPPSDQSQTAPGAAPAVEPPRRRLDWVAPLDVAPWRLGAAVALLGVVTMTLVAVFGGGEAFLSAAPASSHNGPAFSKAAGGVAECGACHDAFGGIAEASCTGCHAEHVPAGAHATKLGGAGCQGCHLEHPEGAAPKSLVATDRCTACHQRSGIEAHQRLLAMTPPPSGVTAPDGEVGFGAGRSPAELHRIHENVPRRCNACHAEAGFAKVADPRASCLRCHGPAERLAQPCAECHREHGPATGALAAADPGGPEPFAATRTPSAVGLALLLCLPIVLLVGVRRGGGPGALPPSVTVEEPPEPELPRKLIHIMEAPCVGCAECVHACPYHVLALVTLESGKKVAKVVNFDSCNECGTCEEVCKPQALTRRLPGAPIPMVERPDLDANYMTSVPGLYLIGEAAGKSLVRNASNLGARTVQHLKFSGVDPGSAAAAGMDYEVAIVGSGPGGLSAGLTASEQGFAHAVFEKGEHWAMTIYTYPKGKPVQNQPGEVENIGALPLADTDRENLLETWTDRLQGAQLNLVLNQEITGIEPLAGPDSPCAGFRITGSNGLSCTALRVILAVGTRGSPRKLSRVEGHQLPKVRYRLDDPAAHDGDHVLVVGGGNSALEAAIAVAEANDGRNTVGLVYRKDSFGRASKENVAKLEGLAEAGRLTLYLSSNPAFISATEVRITGPDDRKVAIPNDYVYTMLGAIAPRRWLEKLGVRYAEKPQGWTPGPSDDLSFLGLS